jgi:hypothetical protein
MGAKSHIV